MPYDKPITIQQQDAETEAWSDWLSLHASVNKARQTEFSAAGATQSQRTLTFTLRYISVLEVIATNTQHYQVIYRGIPYNIIDYDDYMEMHQTIKLTGVTYG